MGPQDPCSPLLGRVRATVGAQAAGRSRLSGTPSVSPWSPRCSLAQPPPWHVASPSGTPQAPLPGGHACFLSALHLAMAHTADGGAPPGGSRCPPRQPAREPVQSRGPGLTGHMCRNRPHVTTSSRRLTMRLTAGSIASSPSGARLAGVVPAVPQTQPAAEWAEAQRPLPASRTPLPRPQAVKRGECPGLLCPGWPF